MKSNGQKLEIKGKTLVGKSYLKSSKFLGLSLLVYLLLAASNLFAQAKLPTLAVLNFKSDGSLKEAQLQSISEKVSSGIGKQGRYTVLDRGSTKERLKEIADQQLGLYDEIKITDATKKLGAEKILVGSVTKFNTAYSITAKIIDVGSGKIDNEQTETIESLDKISDGVESIVKKFSMQSVVVTKKGMLWRSAIIPGWGQLYSGIAVDNRRERIKGLSFMGAGFLFGAGLLVANANYQSAKSDAASKERLDTLVFIGSGNTFNPLGLITYSLANSASGKMDSAANTASLASVLFIGVYAINLLDVIIFGGHDAVAGGNSLFNTNPYAKTDGFKLNTYSNYQNGNWNREVNIKYDFNF
jgi:TolB-like protein